MTDWYYHDPSQGRVGPHTADEMRKRYRDRRIQRDTLAWHAGLREWQPLERLSEALGLDGVQPDMSSPPPLPPPAAVAPRQAAAVRSARRESAPRSGLSGCAIVAIVAAVLMIPVVGILAAIAIPAYQDYTVRAQATSGLYGASSAIRRAVTRHVESTGRCPGNADMAPIIQRVTSLHPRTRLRFGAMEGGDCAFEFTLGGIAKEVDGRTWLHVVYRDGNEWASDCSGGDLPDRYRPGVCRTQ